MNYEAARTERGNVCFERVSSEYRARVCVCVFILFLGRPPSASPPFLIFALCVHSLLDLSSAAIHSCIGAATI